jgi:hypothetical protein
LALLLVSSLVVCPADRAWGVGFILGETKEKLRLQYDVEVSEHGTGRVTIVLTIADEGRLKPLDEVQLVIPAQEKNADGSYWMDLVVSIELQNTEDGKRVGRVHILHDLAKRAQLRLNTHTMDGKRDPYTRLHHVIPIAEHLHSAPARAEVGQPTEPLVAPPATEQNQD